MKPSSLELFGILWGLIKASQPLGLEVFIAVLFLFCTKPISIRMDGAWVYLRVEMVKTYTQNGNSLKTSLVSIHSWMCVCACVGMCRPLHSERLHWGALCIFPIPPPVACHASLRGASRPLQKGLCPVHCGGPCMVLAFAPTADLSYVWLWKVKPWRDGNRRKFPQKWNVSLLSIEPLCQLKICLRKICGICLHFIKLQVCMRLCVFVWL